MIPGNYVWRKRDGDYPITVTESLGIVDGREYVKVEGSSTGIPFDECVLAVDVENETNKLADEHRYVLKEILQKRYNSFRQKYKTDQDHNDFVEWNEIDEVAAQELKEQYKKLESNDEIDNKEPC
jgi:hypothetical protein